MLKTDNTHPLKYELPGQQQKDWEWNLFDGIFYVFVYFDFPTHDSYYTYFSYLQSHRSETMIVHRDVKTI